MIPTSTRYQKLCDLMSNITSPTLTTEQRLHIQKEYNTQILDLYMTIMKGSQEETSVVRTFV